MSDRCRVVDRDADIRIKTIDRSVKNSWKWEWLDRKVEGDPLRRFVRKIDKPGMAFCDLCSKELNYGSRGFKNLEQHLTKKVHREKLKLVSSNYSLTGLFGQTSKTPGHADVPYGIHPMFKAAAKQPKIESPALTSTPIQDRVINLEAMVLGFISEHSLSFALVPHLIEFAKKLSDDKKALDALQMHRTTASYKTRFGLGKTFGDHLKDRLKSVFFSLNLDESTSTNYQKVLTILVSFSCPVNKQVVVHHLGSLTCIKVNSESLFNELVMLFEEKELPWKNLMSVLMDSCNVMRGSKSGLETRLRRNKAPHLLDIDGDACHHIHNAAKAFCKPFNYFLERLLNDVFNDFKWSPDIRELFQEICEILGIKYTMPQRYVSHRWLSVYDVAADTVRLFDALTVFYFVWLSEEEHSDLLPTVVQIYKRLQVSKLSRERVSEIWKAMKEKQLTKEGRERKERIVCRIFTQRRQTRMLMGLYTSVFPLLNNFVLLFELKEPRIHQLYEEQIKLFKDFLGCYMKSEVINLASSGSKLKKLDLSKGQLKPEQMFLGAKALKLIKNPTPSNRHMVQNFLKQVQCAYSGCGALLQKKLPLGNTFLKAVSALDPTARGHSLTFSHLRKLPTLAENVLSENEEELYELEIRKYQTDSTPKFDDSRIDIWWNKEDVITAYPSLSKMANALLSCFHGPQVESSFNLMNDIIDAKSGKLNIQTYTAIQNIKYGLLASQKPAVEYLKKEDYVHEKIDPVLLKNMKSSRTQYNTILEDRKQKAGEKRDRLDIKTKNILNKRKANELCAKAAKKARLSHHSAVKL